MKTAELFKKLRSKFTFVEKDSLSLYLNLEKGYCFLTENSYYSTTAKTTALSIARFIKKELKGTKVKTIYIGNWIIDLYPKVQFYKKHTA